jgi:hypothetical protein
LLSLPGSLRELVKWHGMIKGVLVLRSWVSLIISHENKFAMYALIKYISLLTSSSFLKNWEIDHF